MKKIILIDGNAIGFASQNSTVLTSERQEVQALFGFLKSLRVSRVGYPDHTPVVLWDGSENWRKLFYPEYKANRKVDPKMVKMRENYQAIRPVIAKAVGLLGVRQMIDRHSEADDLAGHLVRELREKAESIMLITGDRDWLQLVRQNVAWGDPRDDSRFCNHANFAEYTGVATPRQFLEMKALMGDTSDNIKGVGGIGEVYAKGIMFQFGSVEGLIKAVAAGTGNVGVGKRQRVRELATGETEARDLFERNIKLMNLIDAPPPVDLKVIKGRFDRERFGELCAHYNFASILRDFTQWTQPFINS